MYKNEQIGFYYKTIAELRQKFNRDPSIEEIAKEMGILKKEVQEIRQILSLNYAISLETPAGHDKDDTMLKDFLPNETLSDVEQKIIADELKRYIKKEIKNFFSLKILSASSPSSASKKGGTALRNINILEDLWGLNDGKEKTEEEVAKKHDVTKQYISEIKIKFLKYLEESSKFKEQYGKYFKKETTEKK